MIGKIVFGTGVTAGGALAVVLMTTTPVSAGAFGILAVFVLMYLVLMSVMTFVIYGVSRIVGIVGGTASTRRLFHGLSLQKSYYYATVVALAPVIVMSMESVGSVGPYELVLIAVLVLLGCVYITKRATRA